MKIESPCINQCQITDEGLWFQHHTGHIGRPNFTSGHSRAGANVLQEGRHAEPDPPTAKEAHPRRMKGAHVGGELNSSNLVARYAF